MTDPARTKALPAAGRNGRSRTIPAPAFQPDSLARRAAVHEGAVHADLRGGDGLHPFRPERLSTERLAFELRCDLAHEGGEEVGLRVLDLSPTGLGLRCVDFPELQPGSPLHPLRLRYRDEVIWEGSAEVVYLHRATRRMGLRFTSGILDVERLRSRDSLVETRLDRALEQHARATTLLPAEFRAGVAAIRGLFLTAREILDDLEREMRRQGWWQQPGAVREICRSFHQRWAPLYRRQILALDQLELSGEAREAAREYAVAELTPLVLDCPLHARAYEKPLGYAGDYRLMTLFFDQELHAPSLYGRFLEYAAHHYAFVQTVVSREGCMRAEVRRALVSGRPQRILSVGAGAALEVYHALQAASGVEAPVEFVLVDQDEGALAFSHHQLTRLLLEERPDLAQRVQVRPVDLSVKQILFPREPGEKAFRAEMEGSVTLLYSAGLFDYLERKVAERLLQRLYAFLAPGGRMVIGNLERDPISTWIMEHILAWYLVYRTPLQMRQLAASLPDPMDVSVRRDETGRCLLLDLARPGLNGRHQA